MEDNTERQIAHLAMIQAIIARMASNSFALKTLTVTLCAGAIALVGAVQKPSVLYVIAAIGSVIMFGWLDAKYFRLELLYRRLYDDVRNGVALEPFDMRIDRYEQQIDPLTRIALRWPVNAVYSTLLVVLILIAAGVWGSN